MKTDDSLHSLAPFWFWNDTITDGEISKQIEMMNSIGANQPIIHARHGLQVDYLSDEWFQKIQHAIKTIKEKNMKVWLYDENNWPSGNCNGKVTQDINHREHFLLIYEIELNAGVGLSIPPDGEHIEHSRIVNATIYIKGDKTGKSILSQVDHYIAEETCTVYLVKLAVNTYDVFGRLAVDYLGENAIKQFIDLTHEKYKEYFMEEFGQTITGIFMDETRFLNALPWTSKFEEEFKKIKGYDIVPLLHLLLREDDSCKYVRYDYFDVVAALLQKNTFKQLYDWCDKNNLIYTGHVLGEETLAAQSRFNADIMRIFRYMHIPGIDHLDNGIGSLNAKMCSSAAHNYGKLIVASESFGATGWDMDYEGLVKISNWLFQQGINLIIIHGFYYSIRDERKYDWPPSYFYQWSHWDRMSEFTKMQTCMSRIMQNSVNDTKLLMYYPVETFWTYYQPEFETITCYFKEGPWVRNQHAREIDYCFQYLCSMLSNENYDFEIFNSDANDCFIVKEGKLVNVHTNAEYTTIILPMIELLTAKTVLLFNEFVKQGGTIIRYNSPLTDVVGEAGEHYLAPDKLPTLQTEKYKIAATAPEVIDLCNALVTRPFKIWKGTDKLTRTQMSYPGRLHDPYLHLGEQQYGIGVVSYVKGDDRIINITNYNDQEEILTIWVQSEKRPDLVIPETDELYPLTQAIQQERGYEIEVNIPKNRAIFIICSMPE
ncbi:hypothetical protein HNQ56_001396 [Anaerotaenia torta]|uniref:glycosyl hydrolase n=1 Tax=Anaerotaenia torta TaxID=433293 RepID=UPI003D1AD196